MGAKDEHTLKAFVEAESYPGPSLIIAYSHCIAHGIALDRGVGARQQKLAVESGQWLLYRYDPRRAERGRESAATGFAGGQSRRCRITCSRKTGSRCSPRASRRTRRNSSPRRRRRRPALELLPVPGRARHEAGNGAAAPAVRQPATMDEQPQHVQSRTCKYYASVTTAVRNLKYLWI